MFMVKLAIGLLAVIASSALYRCGGKGKPYNTKYRDLGCPTVLLALVVALFGFKMAFWWVYLVSFGLAFAALTTYWDDTKNKFLDKICRAINWMYPEDNFWLHGFMCALPGLLFCFVIPWCIPVVRLVICTVGMGLWSKLISNDVKEECGRGAFFIL